MYKEGYELYPKIEDISDLSNILCRIQVCTFGNVLFSRQLIWRIFFAIVYSALVAAPC